MTPLQPSMPISSLSTWSVHISKVSNGDPLEGMPEAWTKIKIPLRKLTVVQLKVFLKRKGFTVSGTKEKVHVDLAPALPFLPGPNYLATPFTTTFQQPSLTHRYSPAPSFVVLALSAILVAFFFDLPLFLSSLPPLF